MCGEPHVIDIGSRFAVFRHGNRAVPEAEIVDSVRTLSHGKERFAIGSLHADNEYVFPVPFDCSAVQCGMDSETLHQIWIGLGVEVITPEKRGVFSCDYRVFVTFVNSIAFYRLILSCYEGLVLCLEPLQTFCEVHNLVYINYLFCYYSIIPTPGKAAKAAKSAAEACPWNGA